MSFSLSLHYTGLEICFNIDSVDKLKKSQEVIIHLTFESINRGDSCIKTYCENNGVNNWLDFITFSSYRTAEASHLFALQKFWLTIISQHTVK